MLGSFAWGFLAASSLIVGGAAAIRYRIGGRPLGLVMALGGGVLISAVAFELVEEAFATSGGDGSVALGLSAGSLVFFAGDALIDRMGGGDRKHSGGRQAEGSAPAIVLGIVLDGIPESVVLGVTVLTAGTVSVASSSRSRSRTCRRLSRPARAFTPPAGRRAACSASGRSSRSSPGWRRSPATRSSTQPRTRPSPSCSPSREAGS